MAGNIIPINTKVDAGSFPVIHSGEDVAFSKKNTFPFNGVLSNYFRTKGNGFITTNGKTITVENYADKVATFKCDNVEYKTTAEWCLSEVKDLDLPVAGDIKGYYADNANNYYVLVQSEETIYLTKNGEINFTADISGLKESFIFHNNKSFGSAPYIGASTESYCYIYLNGNRINSISVTNNHWLDSEKVQNTMDIIPNNGWTNGTIFILGADYADATKSGVKFYSSGTANFIPFMGCVSETGTITGEPIPRGNDSTGAFFPLPHNVLSNKTIAWKRLSNTNANLIQNAVNFRTRPEEDTSYPPKSWPTGYYTNYTKTYYTDITWLYSFKFNASGDLTSVYQSWNSNSATSKFTRFAPLSDSDDKMRCGYIPTNDPYSDLGSFWVKDTNEITEFTNLFPTQYFYSNIAANKGRLFSYGKGWCKALYQERIIYVSTYHPSDSVAYDHIYLTRTPAQLVLFDENASVKYVSVGLENVNFRAINNTTVSGEWTFQSREDTTSLPDSTEWMYISGKRLPLRKWVCTKSISDNGAWEQVGTSAEIDTSIISMKSKLSSDISVHFFEDNPVCISMRGVAITPASTEMENTYCLFESSNKKVIFADKVAYVIKKITSKEDIRINKVADYKFLTNLICTKNALIENRDGKLELQPGCIAYFNEVKPNYQETITTDYPYRAIFAAGSYRAIEDGSDCNDTWFQASGINVNLNDKYAASSALLPAMQFPLYVNSSDVDSFDKEIIETINPPFIPDTEFLEDLAVDTYFTHSLDSTDITYKYTEKNEMISSESEKANTSWWISSDIVIFPLSLGNKLSGINYVASTSKLPGNYSVRLYTNNNNSFLSYNVMTQTYYGNTIFTIYGSSYYYDGQGIYYVGGTNNLTANDFICYAIGMKFLANSGTEAYFYSFADKAIYIFSGSNTLTKSIEFSQLGNVIDAAFSSCNQTLFVLCEDGKMYAVNPQSSAIFEVDSECTELQTTTNGPALLGNGKFELYTITKENNEHIPLVIESEYIGDATKQFRFTNVDILLYSEAPTEITAKCITDVKQQVDNKIEAQTVKIKPKDWKGSYYRIRLTPKDNVGNAIRFSIESEDLISIQSIVINFDTVSDNGGGTVR